MSSLRWLIVPAVLAGWLGLAGTAPAITPQVKDDAPFFSENAVERADRGIRQIKEQYKKDLLVETVPGIPADLQARYKEQGKEDFFQEWARDRAQRAKVNGVYVLICKSPGHVQVEVGNETRKKAFTLQDRRELVRKLTTAFREKKYDQGLVDAVNFVKTTMADNLAGGETGRAGGAGRGRTGSVTNVPPAGNTGQRRGGGGMGIGGWICIGLVCLMGVWLIFGLIRAFTGAGRGYGGGYGPGGYGPGGYGGGGYGGGGGFMSGLLGGLFGAAAGSWMYDSFFRGGHGGGWGASQAYGGGPDAGAQGPAPEDTDYSGSGGDFGDDGGGGGGGDFGDTGGGGGDFGDGGGGDFGGGGGDFGGGGGDFGGGGGDFGGGGGDFGGGGGDF